MNYKQNIDTYSMDIRGTLLWQEMVLKDIVNYFQPVFQMKIIKLIESKCNRDYWEMILFICSWCQPCKMLAPRLNDIMEAAGDQIDFAKVDIDELTDIAMEYGVSSFLS